MKRKKNEFSGSNEYGLDMGYMVSKLYLFIRDIRNYKRDEAARTLARLAKVADEKVLSEDEFSIARSHIVDATYNAIDMEGSQKALCDLVGISQTALSLFLSGDRSPPSALLAYLGYGQKTVYYKLKED